MAETATNVTVGNTSTQVLPANGSRKLAVFTNDSDETIYLSLGTPAEMNKGIRLNAAGGGYEINETNPFIGPIYAICSSGSKRLCVYEDD